MHPVYILLIILMVSFLSYLSWISSSAKVCRTSIKGTKTNVLSPSGTSRNGCLLIWVLGGFSYFPKDNIFQRILKRPEILFHIWQEVLTAFGLSQDKWWLQILTAVKVQPGPRRPMRQIRDEQRLLTCLMRFSLWETWKARCAMSLARLILLHQTPKWRLQERAETEVCVFFFFFSKKKGGITHQARLFWKAALLLLQPANRKWKTPRETWSWKNVSEKASRLGCYYRGSFPI